MNKERLKDIIVESDAELTVQEAKALGKKLANNPYKLSTNQIRNIFGTVRRIEMNWPESGGDADRVRKAQRELLLLKPKMAYQAK